jgi:hypothetical protein
VGQDHGAQGCRDQQRAGDLEDPDVLSEYQVGYPGDVAAGIRGGEADGAGKGHRADRRDEHTSQRNCKQESGDLLALDGLNQRVCRVDPHQHQHEEEQHHDRARVDENLHDPEEVCILGDVEDTQVDHDQSHAEGYMYGLPDK